MAQAESCPAQPVAGIPRANPRTGGLDLSWSQQRTDLALVALATLLAAGLSFLFLGDKSFWLDEGVSVYFARPDAGLWQKLAYQEANLWFYYLLLNLWLRLGDGEAFVRTLSAVFAVAAVPVIYLLGRRLFNARAGAIAALLLAAHPFLLPFAQEARGYSLLVFLVALSSYFFVKAVNDDGRGSWIGHGLATGLALCTHFFAALVYLAQMIALALTRRRASRARGFVASAVIVALFLFPILLFQPLSSDQIQWVPPLTLHQFYAFLTQMAGSRPLLLLYVLAGAVALAPGAPARSKGDRSRRRWSLSFVGAWLAVPIAVAALASVLAKPVFISRYLIVSLPPLVLLAGAGIARVQPRWWRASLLLLFLAGSGRSLSQWYSGTAQDDWRSATTYVLSQTRTGDAAVFYVYLGRCCFDYYCNQAGAAPRPASLDLARETHVGGKLVTQLNAPLLSSLAATYPRVWLFLSRDQANTDTSDRKTLLDDLEREYTLQSEREFPEIKVRLYQRAL